MRTLKPIGLLLAAFLVGGCSTLQGGKLFAPETFGLTPIAPDIYIETGANDAERSRVLKAVERAEHAIRHAYGEVASHPVVNACISEECYERFGGRGSIAKVYGNRILLSPRGLNWHFVAHEWSHAEMLARLGFSAWVNLPQWFDEGIAVAVSEAPEHSEAHWEFLVATNTPRPSSKELHSYISLRQWHAAVTRYGEKENPKRRARGEPELRPVYTAAGHEVRPWLSKAGSKGLLWLIGQLNDKNEFDTAYDRVSNGSQSEGG